VVAATPFKSFRHGPETNVAASAEWHLFVFFELFFATWWQTGSTGAVQQNRFIMIKKIKKYIPPTIVQS